MFATASAARGLLAQQQTALQAASTSWLKQMSSLHALLGAPPQHTHEQPGGSGLPEASQPLLPQLEEPGCEQPDQLPSLCGEPKFKLSLHRRGNRRIPYYVKRKELFAQCKHCGQTGMPHEFLAMGQGCTGQCWSPPTKQYPQEYKPVM